MLHCISSAAIQPCFYLRHKAFHLYERHQAPTFCPCAHLIHSL